MKFIATSAFRNTHKFKVEGRKAGDMHIEKGDEFEVDHEDAALAQVLAQLNGAGRIVDVENQPKAVEQIKKEVAAAKQKEAEQTPKKHKGDEK